MNPSPRLLARGAPVPYETAIVGTLPRQLSPRAVNVLGICGDKKERMTGLERGWK
jgi:hypothetical protein